MADDRPIGLVPPHPTRTPHPANGLKAEVHVGDGAYVSILNPTADTSLGWFLRYGGDLTPFRYSAASLLDSYDYLLAGGISTAEAIRRLRLLRQARAQLLKDTDHD